jgi:predicted PurR-regulated permease PerM
MKYFYILLFLVMLYLVFKILQPFLAAILTSMILAYILHPVYTRVNKHITNKNAAAITTALITILVLGVPTILLLSSLVEEADVIYLQARQVISDSPVFGAGCVPDSQDTLCAASSYINNFLQDSAVKFYLKDFFAKATDFILKQASSLIFSLPKLLLNIFVALFTMFYLFKEGRGIIDKITQLLPFRLHHQKEIMNQIDEITSAVIYGAIIIAVMQGTLGGILFWIFGISSPVFWGLVMILFAFIPFVGASLIWFPAAVIQIAIGNIWAGIGILIGGFIISWLDNLIKPKIIGSKAGIHPVLVLIGVLGGIAFFGLVGGILGPLVLALFITFLKIYHRERIQGY